MDIPVQFRTSVEVRVQCREEKARETRRDDVVDKEVEGEREEDLMDM